MAEITWKSILTKLVGGDHLSAEESEWFVDDLMQGNADPAAVGAALAMQEQLGLTADEVCGAAKAMVSHAVPLNVSGGTTDIVGTGGDGFATVNLSTMGSVAAAAAGVKIVKHGNRAASSKCGAADVLEDLGLPMDLKPEAVGEIGDEVGITFAFARTFHPAMRFVGPIRAALGIPCVFNILGPLGNPAGATMQLMGVYEEKLVEPMAKVLSNLGVKRGAVVYGMDGLDEITACDRTLVCEFKNGLFQKYLLDPRDYGMELAHPGDLKGGDSRENAEITRAVLSGEKGPKRNAVLLNAGMSFHLAEGMSLAEGIQKAADLIDSGKALAFMERFIRLSREAAQ